ncbi:hypothetical protein [Actinomadura terrae]|nr:hypothetical protein [Actinomadura terrae]
MPQGLRPPSARVQHASGVSGKTYYFHFKLSKKHSIEAKAYYGT